MARASGPSATGYFRLKPKEVSLFDIPKLLFSSNLEERKFVDAEGDCKGDVKRRKRKPSSPTGYKYYEDSFLFGLLLITTIMIQTFLLLIDKPLYHFGSLLQNLLYLLSNKARNAFYYLLPGKEFVPHKGVNLFKFKQEGGSQNNAVLSVMACKASYENLDDIQTALGHTSTMEFVDYYGFSEAKGKATTDAFILVDRSNKEHDTYVLALVRGTELFNAREWYIDLEISWYKFGHPWRLLGSLRAREGAEGSLA